MRRRLFTAVSALSLLSAVAICVLWVRSYRLTDQVFWWRADGVRCLGSAQGYVVFQLNRGEKEVRPADVGGLQYVRMQPYSAPRQVVAYGNVQPGDTFVNRHFGGVGWYTVRNPGGVRSATGVAPFWLFGAITAILPIWWTTLRLRSYVHARRQKRVGLCPTCGYDLRATPERCPECGHVPTARAIETGSTCHS